MKLGWQSWFQEKRFAARWQQAKAAAQSTPMAGYYDALLPTDNLLEDTPLIALDFESVGRFICTMQLEDRWFPKERTADGLRLGKLRAQYGLPYYRAHDGLTDAMACAELFLAQCARRQTENLMMEDVLMRG